MLLLTFHVHGERGHPSLLFGCCEPWEGRVTLHTPVLGWGRGTIWRQDQTTLHKLARCGFPFLSLSLLKDVVLALL